MRSIYSISLAALFILNTIGGIGILCYHHFRIHSYIESIIRHEDYSDNLLQLEFNAHETDALIWFKDGREFSHRGQMYDVVRTEVTSDGRTIYHCISDKKEDEIFSNLKQDFNHSPSHNQQLTLQFFRFLSTMVIVPDVASLTVPEDIQQGSFSYLERSYPVYLSVACEPPDNL